MDPEPDAVTSTSTPNGITTILINRQNRRNAVDPSTAKKLYQKILDFENDASQKVCILAGAHGTFCAGADLHEVAGMQQPQSERENLQPVKGRNLAPMGPSRLQVKKPVIAAVSGFAVAGGLELSLIADMRVVEEDAVFGVFCRRWGVPLIDGGTVRLQAIVGLGRALDMILTGRPVDAKEALAMGLANRVVPKGKALEETEKIANQLLAFPQLCMNTDRTSCYYSAYDAESFEDAMRNEFSNGVEVVSVESVKGAALFKAGKGRHGKFDEPSKL
ncbi:enoyl-CoA hydratase/isomerase family protein [Hyaloscypha hepaticicola]|uniref:Enoyl-CoA hydratase/isomerase family protein n=1 Tax=Hyaloscypha hepaticicola TaxID=2082293 RepID=A0A2J6PS76_9HELO|nr:enoyl-CoA hydratase/isomerase family protein [Hyaloscypha hepaticicola]